MRRYTQLDGYTATRGYVIEQDVRGYIWLGTDNGGMSFDGQVFRVAQDISHSPDAEILQCTPLSQGRVLLLPLSGHISYTDNGRFITAVEDTVLARMKMTINNLQRDVMTGACWLSDGRMNMLYRFQGKTIRRYPVGAGGFSIRSVVDNRFIGYRQIGLVHNYWLSTCDTNGSYHDFYDEAGNKKDHGPDIILGSGPNPYHMTTYNPLTRGIRLYDYIPGDSVLRNPRTVIPPFQETANPPTILIDQNHCLWLKPLGDYKGIFYYGDVRRSNKLECLYHFEEPVQTNSIFVDRNNNLWLSSPDNALYFLSAKHLANILLTRRFPLQHEVPQAIAGDGKSGICISYANRAELMYIRGERIRRIALNQFFATGSRRILPLDSTRFVLFNGDLALFDSRTSAVTYFGSKVSRFLCKDVCSYGPDGLIAASLAGVYYLDIPTKGRRRLQKLFEGRTNTVAVLKNKALLIGTPNGLYIKKDLDAPAVRTQHLVLGTNNITDILALRDGGALVGTNAQGLFRLNGDRVQPIALFAQNEARHVRCLFAQDDSTYWVATDNGAYALRSGHDWKTMTVKQYTFYDGLPSNNITDIYVCRDTAYFATTQGLGIIPLKDSARLQMAPPEIYVHAIHAGSHVTNAPDSPVVLPPHQNDLLISLSAVSYESFGNVHYNYRLVPFQDSWIQTANPEIRFSNIPPGDYEFQVYATNAKGIRSLRPVTLRIRIAPAFWQTVYFRVALFLLAAGLLYLVMRRRIRRLERKKYEALQQKKRLAELELEAIKAQINPHFIYNCLNSIKYLNYQAAYGQTQEYLSIFARLIRRTMQYSRQVFIPLEEETDYLSDYLRLEKLRFKDKLQYTIHIAEGMNRQLLLPAMLLQPYVENALKHGIARRKEGGQVLITFEQEGAGVRIVIRDNGPGFSAAQTADALGLHLAGTRALSYNELFDLGIRVTYDNEQNHSPDKTGAIVSIAIRTTNYAVTIH